MYTQHMQSLIRKGCLHLQVFKHSNDFENSDVVIPQIAIAMTVGVLLLLRREVRGATVGSLGAVLVAVRDVLRWQVFWNKNIDT